MKSSLHTDRNIAEPGLGASLACVIKCFCFTCTVIFDKLLMLSTSVIWCERLSGGLNEVVPVNHLAQ